MKKQLIFILSLLVGLAVGYWIYSTNSKPTIYTMAELEQNPLNAALRLPAAPKPNFNQLCESLSALDQLGLEKRLQRPDLELNEVSFVLHYLANRRLEKNDFQGGVHFLRLSAEQYLNPFSHLKLAQIAFAQPEVVAQMFPNQKTNHQRDLKLAVKHLRLAFLFSEWILQHQKDNTIYAFVSRTSSALADAIEQELKTAPFDTKAYAAELAAQEAEAIKQYEAMYKSK